MNDQDELIGKAVIWASRSAEAISASGGSPIGVLKMIPKGLLEILVRNNIFLTYKAS